jgi:hypothetical protein
MAPLGQMDLYPKTGTLQAAAVDTTPLTSFLDWNSDFNGLSRLGAFRGAYSGEGTNPGWRPSLAIEP